MKYIYDVCCRLIYTLNLAYFSALSASSGRKFSFFHNSNRNVLDVGLSIPCCMFGGSAWLRFCIASVPFPHLLSCLGFDWCCMTVCNEKTLGSVFCLWHDIRSDMRSDAPWCLSTNSKSSLVSESHWKIIMKPAETSVL